MARNMFGLACPKCGHGGRIDIAASVWVRLMPYGTDADAATHGDHEWDDRCAASCGSCGWVGAAGELKEEQDDGED